MGYTIYERVKRRGFESEDDLFPILANCCPKKRSVSAFCPLTKQKLIAIIEDKFWILDDGDLLELAGAWSINPTTLEMLNLSPCVEVVGRFPRE